MAQSKDNSNFKVGHLVQCPLGHIGQVLEVGWNNAQECFSYAVHIFGHDGDPTWYVENELKFHMVSEESLSPMSKDNQPHKLPHKTIAEYQKTWNAIYEASQKTHGIPADADITKAPEKQKNAPRYMVYVTGENMPKKIHMTYQSADLEAQRLAKLNPEKDVIIFKSLFAFRAELTLNTSEFGLD